MKLQGVNNKVRSVKMGNWFAGMMKDEVPFEEIEAREDEFHKWKVEPFDLVENGYEGVIDLLKTYTA